jgi:retinol dehydrogenase-12
MHSLPSCTLANIPNSPLKPYTQRYGQSKLAVVHYTRTLSQLHSQIDVAAVHPGRINTQMAAGLAKESWLVRLSAPLAPLLSLSPAEGAKNHLWAATNSAVVSGKYYEPIGVPDKETQLARDAQLGQKLWDWTEHELKGIRPIE